MRRFYAEKLNISGDSVTLTGDEARHIKTVLRMRTGDEVLLINGEGLECIAEITDLDESSVRLAVKGRHISSAEPDKRITLFQCLPKQGKMEVIIQKCVELGIHAIVPTVSNRCVVKLEGKENKLLRWNKVSVEAAKQCGRAFVPEVKPPVRLEKIDFSCFDAVLLAYENEYERSLKSVLRSGIKLDSTAIVIGPEGGFEPSEAEYIINAGGIAVSLGKRILRTETAGMAMLAQMVYELDV